MAIALTSDPIITLQAARDLLKWPSDDETRMSINSVSARFLRYTNRLRITSGTVTEYQSGRGQSVLWLHATPITSITSVEIYCNGTLSETVASTDYTVNLTTGRLYLHGTTAQHGEGELNIKVVYTGGWTDVPGDLQESALLLMTLDKRRRDGLIGVHSQSREGFSSTYEHEDLPQAIRERWEGYRVIA